MKRILSDHAPYLFACGDLDRTIFRAYGSSPNRRQRLRLVLAVRRLLRRLTRADGRLVRAFVSAGTVSGAARRLRPASASFRAYASRRINHVIEPVVMEVIAAVLRHVRRACLVGEGRREPDGIRRAEGAGRSSALSFRPG